MRTPTPFARSIVDRSIVERLQAAIGLDPQGLDPARLNWIIQARCRHLHLHDASAYSAFLDRSPKEIDALIEAVVVQETRFFRDPAVFGHIRSALTQLAAATTGPLRILSAPCGTGEEAYSLAATVQLLGLPLSRFSVDAFDISQSALDIAVRGTYPARAINQLPPESRQVLTQSAEPTAVHWTIPKDLRDHVHFGRRNLAEAGALGDAPQYHLILCRNLFIYLAPASRAALARSLSTALLPGGRLFLGTADRVEELNALFAPMRPAASFAFMHRTAAPARTDPPLSFARQTPVRRILSRLHLAKRVDVSVLPDQSPAQAELSSPALALLERALAHRRHGELLKAERCCRQALYLNSNLMPALELLQALWDEQPNLRLRRALRDRILRNRLQSKESG
jgi:chemotaxis protein methyltransferase WspC